MKALELKSKAVNAAQVKGGCGVCSAICAIVELIMHH
jgi:hypothetical protein